MKTFCEMLEEKGITVEDFTGHLGAYLDASSTETELAEVETFLEEIYSTAVEALNKR